MKVARCITHVLPSSSNDTFFKHIIGKEADVRFVAEVPVARITSHPHHDTQLDQSAY
jgi:hypothetical protein